MSQSGSIQNIRAEGWLDDEDGEEEDGDNNDNDDENGDIILGMDLEDFLPESTGELENDAEPESFSNVLTVDGKSYLKSSLVASLSSHRSKKVTIPTLRVRGVALEDLHNSRLDELDPDNLEEGDYMKRGDLAAILVQSGDKICMAVLEVAGFQFGKEKTTRVVATLDDLEDSTKQIKISGQVIVMQQPSAFSSWEWTRNYLPIDTNAKDG